MTNEVVKMEHIIIYTYVYGTHLNVIEWIVICCTHGSVQKFRLSEFVGDSVGWIKQKYIQQQQKRTISRTFFVVVIVDVPLSNGFIVYMQNSIRCRMPCETHLRRQPDTDARGRCVTIENSTLSHSRRQKQINIYNRRNPTEQLQKHCSRWVFFVTEK